jgi:hypothetical protein
MSPLDEKDLGQAYFNISTRLNIHTQRRRRRIESAFGWSPSLVLTDAYIRNERAVLKKLNAAEREAYFAGTLPRQVGLAALRRGSDKLQTARLEDEILGSTFEREEGE